MRTFPADSSIDVTTLEEIFLDVTKRQKRGKIKKNVLKRGRKNVHNLICQCKITLLLYTVLLSVLPVL